MKRLLSFAVICLVLALGFVSHAQESNSNVDLAKSVGVAIQEMQLDYSNFEILTFKGIVRLRGIVASSDVAKQITERVQTVPLVKRVINQLDIERHPTLFIAGDSTASGNAGWGNHVQQYFTNNRLKVVNRAVGGRSTRTFITGGNWAKLIEEVHPGDWVIIQFGHNDISPVNDATRARGVLPGIGPETEEIDNQLTKQKEVVQTFGGYLRKMIADVREKKAEPILMSPTVRNIWADGKVERGVGEFRSWAKQVADAEKTMYIDLTGRVADEYERIGQTEAAKWFPRDHTHTSVAGAQDNAKWVLAGLKGLREQALNQRLNDQGVEVDAVAPSFVTMRTVTQQQFPGGFREWLNLPDVANVRLPSVFLIGDSTCRTDRGTGYGPRAQYGWGDPFENAFDRSQLNVVNRAVGGTGVRSFINSGYWNDVLQRLQPGDVVIMQFGHNDNGARGALRGTGDDTQEVMLPSGEKEIVHSFGWYLKQYIAETRSKGARPIVCSLIPRNSFRDGKFIRSAETHAAWAREVAMAEKADFIDLYDLIATKYEELGQEKTAPLFSDGTHTKWDGAVLNSQQVLAGLAKMPDNPLAGFLRRVSRSAKYEPGEFQDNN